MAAVAPVPLIPARRLHSEIEVIDVDALDDDIIYSQTRRSVRPRLSPAPGSSEAGPSRENPIVVLDSDEEMDSRGGVRRAPVRRRHRLRSPPPPPPAHYHVHPPPVPPLPAHLTAHHHPPAILPSTNPLPFEANMVQSRRQTESPRQHTPRAAPRSQHQPAMGLGGALIALNRQQQIEERIRQVHEEEAARQRATRRHNWVERWMPTLPGFLFGEDLGGWSIEPLAARPLDMGYIVKAPEKSAAWKPAYTHPDKPVLGFTHNFDLSEMEDVKGTSTTTAIVIADDDDTAGPSTSEPSPALVCARCLDPLVLAGTFDDDETRKRRVWALRCGHLLDGKCLEELMRPAPVPESHEAEVSRQIRAADECLPDVKEDQSYRIKGKGKARAEPLRSSRKGKARAAARTALGDQKDVSMSSVTGPPSLAPDNSIRSRLRSRRPLERADSAIASNLVAAAPVAASGIEPPGPSRPLMRRRSAAQTSSSSVKPVGRARGKGRNRKPQLLQSHEFVCPVEGCGRVHKSVLMTGEDWKMDATEGALPLFV